MNWSSLSSGNHMNIDSAEPRLLVIRSLDDSRQYGADLAEKLSAVDFSRQTVVGVVQQVNTGGYEMRIEALARQDEEQLEVTARLIPPPPGSITMMVISQPYALAVVDASDAKLKFSLKMK